jgi:hypothetical protein
MKYIAPDAGGGPLHDREREIRMKKRRQAAKEREHAQKQTCICLEL